MARRTNRSQKGRKILKSDKAPKARGVSDERKFVDYRSAAANDHLMTPEEEADVLRIIGGRR